MSSLIFHTDEKQVYVATDTLAVASNDKRPFNFTTKVFILPHLRMLITGTGVGGILDLWFTRINCGIVTSGIDNLAIHTPRNLASIWAKYKPQVRNSSPTTTIYHFGFSETTKVIHSYVFRSENGFISQKLPYGLAAKPEYTCPTSYNLPDDLLSMMNGQRTIQSGLPKDKRVYIGGEMQVHHLTGDGYNVFTHHRFEDYAADQKIMLESVQQRARESSM